VCNREQLEKNSQPAAAASAAGESAAGRASKASKPAASSQQALSLPHALLVQKYKCCIFSRSIRVPPVETCQQELGVAKGHVLSPKLY
jgi:hypothetical protein